MLFYVGTSGWSYPKGAGTWNGVFYPGDMRPSEQLPFYAQFFNAVEINSSFYRIPTPRTVQVWVEKTPSEFRFTAKLFMKFTHPDIYHRQTGQDPSLTEADFEAFRVSMAPLLESGKLGAVLAQFPPSFRAEPASLERLADLLDRLQDLPMVVELRHLSWSESPTTRQLLEERGVGWAIIDEPKYRTSIGDVPRVGRTAYLRFHGRNYKDWWKGDAEARYNHLYSPEEQEELAGLVRDASRTAEEVYIFYNNHYRAKAVVNALEMRATLGHPPTAPLPGPLLAEYPRLASLVAPIRSERGPAPDQLSGWQ